MTSTPDSSPSAPGAVEGSPSGRRTQAERRRQTRQRLLRATVDCLAEEGWRGTTTRAVAQRAGVTLGALQYYFPTKLSLVRAALEDIVERSADDFLELNLPDDPRDRVAAYLDWVWEFHRSPLANAFQELLAQARTDRDLAEFIAPLTPAAERVAIEGATLTLSGGSPRPDLEQWVHAAVAAMRGLVVVSFHGDDTAERRWPVIREFLIATFPSMS